MAAVIAGRKPHAELQCEDYPSTRCVGHAEFLLTKNPPFFSLVVLYQHRTSSLAQKEEE